MPRTTKNNQKAWITQWKKMTKILPKASPRDPNLLYMGGQWLRLCRLNIFVVLKLIVFVWGKEGKKIIIIIIISRLLVPAHPALLL